MPNAADYRQEAKRLSERAAWLGPTKWGLAFYEEAIQLADMHQDEELGFELRTPYVRMASHLLRGDRAIEAFHWMLTRYDQDPQRHAGRSPLSLYRPVIGQMCNQPQISRAQIDARIADMQRRLQAEGESLREVHALRRNIGADLGDKELARDAHRELQRLPAGSEPKRDLWQEVLYWIFIGDERRAIQCGELSLNTVLGKPNTELSNEKPGWHDSQVCAHLLLPLANCGRLDEAVEIQTRIVSTLWLGNAFNWPDGEHLKFLALDGRSMDAVKLFKPFYACVVDGRDPLTHLHFFLDSIPMLDQLHASGVSKLLMKLPDTLPVPHDNRRYSIALLRDHVHQRAAEIATQFDTRNGNNYYATELQHRKSLQPFRNPREASGADVEPG